MLRVCSLLVLLWPVWAVADIRGPDGEVDTAVLVDLAAEARVERLLQQLGTDGSKTLLVGSSMGGYVSLVASAKVDVSGLLLIAPALYLPGFKHQHYPSRARHIEVIHGWSDEVIPLKHSIG